MTNKSKYRLVALAAGLALMATACGAADSQGSSPTLPSLTGASVTPDEPTTTTNAVDPEDAMREYTTCMRDNGVDIPDLSSGGSLQIEGSLSDFDEMFQEADEECSPILADAFGDFELSPDEEAEFRDRELAFAQCMRDAGVDWPDPGAGSGAMIEIPAGEDFDMQAMSETLDSCSNEVFGGTGEFQGLTPIEVTP